MDSTTAIVSSTAPAAPQGVVPRGRGEASKRKNAAKKRAIAEKAAREAKLLADAKLAEFKFYKPTPVPASLKRACPSNPQYLVCKRTNAVPASWNQRLMLWSLVHLGPHMGYVPSDEEQDAAKGINLMDFFLRCSLVPLAGFENLEDAKAYIEEVCKNEKFDAQMIQVLQFYSENPVPCYANGTDRTYVDKEMAEFMKTYNKENRANYELQKKRILELPAVFQEAGRQVKISDPEDPAFIAANDPSRIKVIQNTPVSDEQVMSALESGELEVSPDDADIILGGDPRTSTLVRDLVAIDGRIVMYEKQIEATRTLIEELRAKKQMMKQDLAKIKGEYDEACDSDSDSDDDESDDEESADEPVREKVRRLGVAPDGSRFKVTLDGSVVPIAAEVSADSFEIVVPAETDQDSAANTQKLADQGKGTAKIPSVFASRVAALGSEGGGQAAAIAFGVGSEQATDRINDMFALVHEQNARNKARIAAEMAAEAAGKAAEA